MTDTHSPDNWSGGDAYYLFMGRWSQRLAEVFVPWLKAAAGQRWLDVGCGTGALTGAVLALADPSGVVGIEPSAVFVEYARQHTRDPRARFEVGSAQELPVADAAFDVAAASLVLNFVPDAVAALAEMKRSVRPGGTVAAVVWDYAEGMQMIRMFFDAATALDPAAATVDEGPRFAAWKPAGMTSLFEACGLRAIESATLEFDMRFHDFDDYWQPFTGGVGPAPSYLASLPPERQAALQAEVRRRLPVAADGSIALKARAWAVKGEK